jgi:cytochrome c553
MALAHAQDAAAGQKKAAMCIGCHGIPGYQASFPEVHKVPMISGQGAKYITSRAGGLQEGRAQAPDDARPSPLADRPGHGRPGGLLRKARRPTIKTVADSPAPSAEVAALLTKGACASCHGANFNKPIDPSYPKLAGQHADYLYVALKAYQTDGNPRVGRGNAIMAGQAKQFKLPN